jgi:hypothetical protein
MRIDHNLPVTQMVAQKSGPLLALAAILATALPIEPVRCGIYFLIRDGQIVYVGQSVNVTIRIASHATMRRFDSWSWVPCERAGLNAMERAYIDALMPEENLDSMTRRARWESRRDESVVHSQPLAWPTEIVGEIDNS